VKWLPTEAALQNFELLLFRLFKGRQKSKGNQAFVAGQNVVIPV